MNALKSYSSDNESDEEPTSKKMNKLTDCGTNYDDVGMDISEESGDESEADNEQHQQSVVGSFNNANTPVNNTKKIYSNNNNSNHNDREYPSKREDSHFQSDEERKGVESTKENEKNNVDKSRGRASDDRTKDHRHSSSHRKRDRSRERSSRDGDRSTRDHKDSRDHRESRRSTDSRDHRRPNRGDDRKPSGSSTTSSSSSSVSTSNNRRSRSRSRERRRSRSRSRSRDRERRKRRTRSRSKSKSRERERDRDWDRKRPHEIRKEAQQKLAAFKASNPNFDHNEMLKRGMEAQFAEVQKNTGVTLPSYYNPATMNPLKIAEQERKKRLLWGNKSKADTAAPAEQPSGGSAEIWVNTKFSNDSDGKMAEKFKRLMGVKSAGRPDLIRLPAGSSSNVPQTPERSGGKESSEIMEKQESLFSSMEKQYEMARLATHTHKGFGLGFTSQSYLPK